MNENEPIMNDDVVDPEEFDGHDGIIEIVPSEEGDERAKK